MWYTSTNTLSSKGLELTKIKSLLRIVLKIFSKNVDSMYGYNSFVHDANNTGSQSFLPFLLIFTGEWIDTTHTSANQLVLLMIRCLKLTLNIHWFIIKHSRVR